MGADPVAGAVVEVLPGQPEAVARDRVEMGAGQPDRPAQPRDRDHALQDAGEGGARLGVDRRGGADGNGAGDVGGAVKILAPLNRPAAISPARTRRLVSSVTR